MYKKSAKRYETTLKQLNAIKSSVLCVINKAVLYAVVCYLMSPQGGETV
jgi:hypothetical protein